MSGIRNSTRRSSGIAVVVIALLAIVGAAGAQVTIDIWGNWSSDSPVIGPLIPLFEQYEAENPNVKISYAPQGEYFDRITVAAATGVLPDLFFLTVREIPQFIDSGLLSPLVTSDGSPLYDPSDLVSPDLRPAVERDGSVYSVLLGGHGIGIMYNKDHFVERGLDPDHGPQTWDDVATYARTLTIASSDSTRRYGLSSPDWFQSHLYFLSIVASGGTFGSEDGTSFTFTDDIGISSLSFWNDMVQAGTYAVPGTARLVDGSASMEFAGAWDITSGVYDQAGINYGTAPFPQRVRGAAEFFPWAIVASAGTEKYDEMVRFVEWLAAPERILQPIISEGTIPSYHHLIQDPVYLDFIESEPVFQPFIDQLGYIKNYHQNIQGIFNSHVLPTLVDAIMRVYRQEDSPINALSAAETTLNGVLRETLAR